MKHYLFIAFFLISINVFSQSEFNLPIDSTTNQITFTGVVKLDSNYNKNLIFGNSKLWIAESYKSASNVIQLDDKESGKIVIKAVFPVHIKFLGGQMAYGHISYTFTIQIKDGKYKYEITNFNHTGLLPDVPTLGSCDEMRNYDGIMYNRYQYILSQIPQNIEPLLFSYNKSLKDNFGKNSKDDW